MIWRAVPSQLSRENKKFVFAAMHKSARARGYEGALQWLDSAGLLLRCHLVSAPKPPLAAHAKRQMFKVYLLDVGLLGAMNRTPPRLAAQGDTVFEEYRGALTENYLAQQLAAAGVDLYYWTSDGTAEVDFLLEQGTQVFPLEAKAGINPRSKSLGIYVQRHQPRFALRSTLRNLRSDGQILNVPLYAINALSQLVRIAASLS